MLRLASDFKNRRSVYQPENRESTGGIGDCKAIESRKKGTKTDTGKKKESWKRSFASQKITFKLWNFPQAVNMQR